MTKKITSDKFVKTGGTLSEFLKADGSVDNNNYALSNGTNAYGIWSIDIAGGASSADTAVNSVTYQETTNVSRYISFVDNSAFVSNNGVSNHFVNQNFMINPGLGILTVPTLTATSIIKQGGTSSQYLMADGSVSTGIGGNYVDLTSNQTVAGNKTFTGTINLSVPAISGRESILKGSVSDNSVDMFQIANGTTVSNRFVPTFVGYTNGVYGTMAFRGLSSSSNDSFSSSPYIQFLAGNTDNPSDPNNGTLTAPVNRKLFTWGTTVDYMTITADGSLLLKTGNKVDAYQFNNSTNGYYILDSGLILQWAYLTSGSGTYNFPLAWPTGAFSVVLSTNRTSSGSLGMNHVGNVTTSSYYAVIDATTGRMFAIGR